MSNENSLSSENEFSDGEEEIEEIELNKNKMILDAGLNTKDFDPGNAEIHFLPFKIAHTGHCRVSAFFDPLIEKRHVNKSSNKTNTDNNLQIEGENNKITDYKTSFRGRILNGKKVFVGDNFKMSHVSLKRDGVRTKKAIIKGKKDISEYFIWKFDEEVPYNNTFLNMGTILNNLEVLK